MNMKMGDAEYRKLLSKWSNLYWKSRARRRELDEINARLEAAELQDSRECRIADVVDDYTEAMACGDMSGAEL